MYVRWIDTELNDYILHKARKSEGIERDAGIAVAMAFLRLSLGRPTLVGRDSELTQLLCQCVHLVDLRLLLLV